MPSVSIIVPYKNGEKYLERCIKKIKEQEYKDYEIILIDDSSDDNSKDVIEKYRNDEKIKYYYLEDNTIGVGKARNYGIEKATGKYIMFVDVDDYIEKKLLINIEKYMKLNIDVIKYKLMIDEKVKVYEPIFDVVSGKEAFSKLCFDDKYFDSPCLYLMKKEYLIKNSMRFEENMYHEDFGLVPFIVLNAKTVVAPNIVGYHYIQTEDSIMRNKDYGKTVIKVKNKFEYYEKIKNTNCQKIKEYYTNSIILSLKDLKKDERKFYEKKIMKNKMIKNLRVHNFKQFIKKLVLNISINLYLKLK